MLTVSILGPVFPIGRMSTSSLPFHGNREAERVSSLVTRGMRETGAIEICSLAAALSCLRIQVAALHWLQRHTPASPSYFSLSRQLAVRNFHHLPKVLPNTATGPRRMLAEHVPKDDPVFSPPDSHILAWPSWST